MKRGLFIQTGVSDKGHPLAFKIDSDDKDEILHILREKGYDEITILRTNNLCSAEIPPIVPHGVKGTKIWVYPISPEFNEQYGPFEEVEKMDLRSFVSEADDDEHDETFNVLRQIKGLSVKKLGNGKYRLKLSEKIKTYNRHMDMIYTHNKSRLGLLRRGMRPSNMPLSRLLPESWNHLPGTVNISCRCVNSPFNLKNLIYEKEEKNRVFFLYEGLIKTFPSKRFIDGFWKKVGEIVPDELKELTWDETGILPLNTPIFGDEDTTNMTDEIHGSIGFFVPVYRDEIDTLRKTVNKVANDMAVHGYCLTDVDEMDHALVEEIAVVRVQFEAKFPADRFRFAKVLHHVAPLKYLQKIRRNGLVPKSKSAEFEYEDRVYLFNNMPLGGVLQYGERKTKTVGDSGFCLFSIDYGKLSSLETFKDGRLKFYVDNAFDNNNGMAQALFTYGNIPLSVIDNEFKIYHLATMNNPTTDFLRK